MKKIRVQVSEIKNHLYAKIPDVVADIFKIKNGDDIQISIHEKDFDKQENLWDIHPEDVDEITFPVKHDVHTMNMYNSIYVPQEY